MDAILASHSIDPDRLRDDDFDNFFSDRQERLLCIAEQAMGKKIERDPSAFSNEVSVEGAGGDWH